MSGRPTLVGLATLLLASVAGGAGMARAAVDPAMFQDLHWRSIGPFRGGRVLAVAGAPDDARRFYFGAVNGGVWRTEDAGRTWRPIFDAEPVGSIGALAVAPSAPKVIYVGTGEADIAQSFGMFKSINGGATWAFIGLKDTQQIGKILVDPRNPDMLLVAALGHPYGPNAERGVFRSTDGGRTWTRTLFKDTDTGAIDMAYQPRNPDVVYASLWRTRRPPWNVYPPSSGPGGGVYKSVDGGRTWTALTGRGLPDNPGHIGLATTPAQPNRAFALVDAVEGAASTAPTMRGRAGPSSAATSESGSAAGTSAGLRWTLRTPTGSGSATPSSCAPTTGAPTSCPSRATRRATTSTACGSIPQTRIAASSASTRGRW